MKKRFIIIAILSFCLILNGCTSSTQTDEFSKKPDFKTKTIEFQYAAEPETYSIEIPENWKLLDGSSFVVQESRNVDNLNDASEEDLPYMVCISDYLYNYTEEVYESLFNHEYEQYENAINSSSYSHSDDFSYQEYSSGHGPIMEVSYTTTYNDGRDPERNIFYYVEQYHYSFATVKIEQPNHDEISGKDAARWMANSIEPI